MGIFQKLKCRIMRVSSQQLLTNSFVLFINIIFQLLTSTLIQGFELLRLTFELIFYIDCIFNIHHLVGKNFILSIYLNQSIQPQCKYTSSSHLELRFNKHKQWFLGCLNFHHRFHFDQLVQVVFISLHYLNFTFCFILDQSSLLDEITFHIEQFLLQIINIMKIYQKVYNLKRSIKIQLLFIFLKQMNRSYNNEDQIQQQYIVLMQQMEFVLQNFFIVRPNKSSTYKLKIVINHETSQQKYKDSQSKYKFKFAINDRLLEKPYGYISLLQKASSNENQYANYLQIGKGQLDFNDIITHSKDSNISTLHGVIYGTRAVNFDKLVAKYGYQIVKSNLQYSKIQNSKKEVTNRIKFKNHKATQKLPSIKLNQAILDQSSQINAKIRKLTSTIMEQNEDQQTVEYSQPPQNKQKLTGSQLTSKQTIEKLQSNAYYLKINDKIEKTILLQTSSKLKWIQIKNIQINLYQSNTNDNKHKADYILIKILQNNSIKLFQIIIKIKFNSNNRIIDLFFAIPVQLHTINFQVTFMQSKMQLLQGSSSVDSSINKIIQLYSSIDNEQTGFISIEILKSRPQDYNLTDYGKQIEQFDQIYKKFGTLINQSSLNKFTINSISPSSSKSIRHSTLHQQSSNTRFYSNPNQKNSSQKLKNIPISLKKNKVFDLSDTQKINPKRSIKNQQLSALNSLYLKIKNIYLNLYYEMDQQLFLKFIVKDHAQTTQINSGFNNLDQKNKCIVLDNLYPNELIKILCYSSNSNQKVQLLGKCSVNIRDIIKSTTNQMKIFITNNKSLIGFIILELNIYRIKNNKLRAYKRSQLTNHSTLPQQSYQLQLSQHQVRHTQNLSSKFKNQNQFNNSFIVEQQNFR